MAEYDEKADLMHYDEDDAWMEFRAQCANAAKERIESVMKKFLNQVKVPDGTIIGYSRDTYAKIFEITTNRPGILIGPKGAHAEYLKNLLKEEYKAEFTLRFHEIDDFYQKTSSDKEETTDATSKDIAES